MESVFEKIIEKLEKEKSSYFLTIANTGNEHLDSVYEKVGDSIDKAIEIVKQAAADYSNGWIPCSSGRLPEENTYVEVTVEEIADDVGGKRYYNAWSWLQDGQWVIKKNPYKPTVIAWRYPTEPYQPKGEIDG